MSQLGNCSQLPVKLAHKNWNSSGPQQPLRLLSSPYPATLPSTVRTAPLLISDSRDQFSVCFFIV